MFSQIKFAKSERTGEQMGFVSRHSKTPQSKGGREVYAFGNRAVIPSEDLKGTVEALQKTPAQRMQLKNTNPFFSAAHTVSWGNIIV